MPIIRQFKAFRTSSKRSKEFGGCLLLLLLFSTTLCNNWKMLWSLLYRNGLISRFHRFTGNSLKPSIPPNRPSIFWDTVKNWVKIQVRCRFKSCSRRDENLKEKWVNDLYKGLQIIPQNSIIIIINGLES